MIRLNWIISVYHTQNHLTVCKQTSSGSFENNVTYELFVYKSYI